MGFVPKFHGQLTPDCQASWLFYVSLIYTRTGWRNNGRGTKKRPRESGTSDRRVTVCALAYCAGHYVRPHPHFAERKKKNAPERIQDGWIWLEISFAMVCCYDLFISNVCRRESAGGKKANRKSQMNRFVCQQEENLVKFSSWCAVQASCVDLTQNLDLCRLVFFYFNYLYNCIYTMLFGHPLFISCWSIFSDKKK